MRERISYLEATVNDERDRVFSPIQQQSTGRTNPLSLDGQPNDDLLGQAVSEVEYLSVAAMSGPDKQHFDVWKNISFSGFVKEAVAMSNLNPGVPARESHAEPQLPLTEMERDMRTIGLESLQSHIKTYHRFGAFGLPCISQEECMQSLEHVFQAIVQGQTLRFSHEMPEKLVFALSSVTIGMLLSSRSEKDGIVTRNVQALRYAVDHVATQSNAVTMVQCLMLVAVLSMLRPHAASTWHLLGLAMTKAVSIGLHRQPIVGNSEASGLLFWAIYVLDRWLACSMDRPFALEDADIALSMPEIRVNSMTDSNTPFSSALQIWTIHHARMLSDWRRSSNSNFELKFASYRHWHGTCSEIITGAENHNISAPNDGSVVAFMHKHQAQLTCRALVQLLAVSGGSLHPAILPKLKAEVETEVTQYITCSQSCVLKSGLPLTFLDAYDTSAAVIAYICIQQISDNTRRFSLGVKGMKVIMSAIEVIQNVSHQFTPMQGMIEVIWAFLAALEEHNSGDHPQVAVRSSSEPLENLHSAFASCEVPVPDHLRQLMESCFHPSVP
jgi:hypothetical protein